MANIKYLKNKKWSNSKKIKGLCPRCGKKPETRKVLCDSCAVKTRKYRRRLHIKVRISKICLKCGIFVSNGNLRCQECRVEYNEYQKERRLIRLNKIVKTNKVMKRNFSFNNNIKDQKMYSDEFVPGEFDVCFDSTEYKPGSEEKVEVLCFRYEKGLPLWHTEDEKLCLLKKREVKE